MSTVIGSEEPSRGLAGDEEGSITSKAVEERSVQLGREQTLDGAVVAPMLDGVKGSATWDVPHLGTTASFGVSSINAFSCPHLWVSTWKRFEKGPFLADVRSTLHAQCSMGSVFHLRFSPTLYNICLTLG